MRALKRFDVNMEHSAVHGTILNTMVDAVQHMVIYKNKSLA